MAPEPPPVPERPVGEEPAAGESARAAAQRRGALAARALAALAVLLPAGLAAGVVLVVGGGRGVDGPAGDRTPAQLARLAERLPASSGISLRPLSQRPAAAAAGTAPGTPGAAPLESLSGGIRPAPPARISIPAAGVNAPVRPVAARAEALEVPAIGTAGWFEGGPRPGERGRSVVIGHLDTRKGPGLFARVPGLPPGTLVAVTDRRGGVHRYRVVGGAQVAKSRFPAKYIYGPADAPVLVLITCGGDYDSETGYEDNVLLYARA